MAFAWQPGIASLYDDSVSYLVMAQAFAPYGEPAAAIAAAYPYEKYPPFFPLLIALVGGAHHWPAAHVLVAVAFGLGVFLLAIHVRRITGSNALGIVAALGFAAMPGAWLQMKGILSEFPYIALSLAALVVHGREAPSVSRARSIALGLLLAAALLTRTIGVALLAAVAFAEGLRWLRTREGARLRAWIPAFVIPLAAAALWYALRPSGGEDEYLVRSAGVARDFSERGFTAVANLVSSNISATTDAWLNALLIYWGEPWQPRFLIASAVGLAGLGACARRAWAGEADGAYSLAFLAILLVWPFPGQMYRLAFPVAPLVLAGALWAFSMGLREEAGERVARRIAMAVGIATIAICTPALFFIAERFRAPEPGPGTWRRSHITEFYRIPDRRSAELNAAVQIAVFADLERIRTTTPREARVMWYMPSYVALLSGRRGVALDIPDNPGAMADQVRAGRPDFIYLSNVHPRDSAQRHGSPLRPLAYALEYSDVVWSRRDRNTGEPLAVLLRVDPQRLGTALAVR